MAASVRLLGANEPAPPVHVVVVAFVAVPASVYADPKQPAWSRPALAVGAGITVILIAALLALTGEAHGSLDTISQVTASALTSVVETKVGLVSPATGLPFRFH